MSSIWPPAIGSTDRATGNWPAAPNPHVLPLPSAPHLFRGRIIVIGNEKGGSGKSTTAMHLIVSLLELGYSVASIDADVHQRSLTRYLDNRRRHIFNSGRTLPMPEHGLFETETNPLEYSFQEQVESRVHGIADMHGIVVIDTPGQRTLLSKVLHSLPISSFRQ